MIERRANKGSDMARRKRDGVAASRGMLYTLARLLGDVQAVRKGSVGRRVGRRITGRATGKTLGKLFR